MKRFYSLCANVFYWIQSVKSLSLITACPKLDDLSIHRWWHGNRSPNGKGN